MTIRPSALFPPYAGNFRKDRPGNVNAGSCTLCRSSKVSAERPCVELGNNARPFREGMVVLCHNCAVEVGTAAGMLSQVLAGELCERLAEAKAQIDRLDAELIAVTMLRDALKLMADRGVAVPA